MNKNVLEMVASRLKVAPEKLMTAIADEKATLELPEIEVFEKTEFETLKSNLSKESYEKGKIAGFEMPLKESKKFITEKFGIQLEGIKNFNELFETSISHIQKDFQNKFSGEAKGQIETLTKEKETLQKSLSEMEKSFATEKEKILNEFTNEKINNSLLNEINSIPFSVPKHIQNSGEKEVANFLKSEKHKFISLLKSNFEFALENNQIVIKQNGEVLKDKLQNPIKTTDMLLKFAKENYFNLSDNQQNLNGNKKKIDASGSFKGMNEEEFEQMIIEQQINKGSLKYLELLKKFKNDNK